MEKRYTDLLTGLLNMAEAMLVCGSEITRVEDTITRVGLAYGAVQSGEEDGNLSDRI